MTAVIKKNTHINDLQAIPLLLDIQALVISMTSIKNPHLTISFVLLTVVFKNPCLG